MGVVYEALDQTRGERVALKTLRRVDAQNLYRLKREFRALQGLSHPNLVGLGELVEEAGRWFFTMELVEGVDFLAYVLVAEAEAWVSAQGIVDATRMADAFTPGFD
jgi:serine/threonine protein kinase